MVTSMSEITIELTDYCPHTCPFCSSKAGPNGKRYITMQTIRSLVTDKYDVINLSGGEPLAHPLLWPIIQYCQEHLSNHGEIWLYTNVISGIRYNAYVRDRVKIVANVTIHQDTDEVHILKRIEQGREAERPKVHISGCNCAECHHVEISPDGEIGKPCKKRKEVQR